MLAGRGTSSHSLARKAVSGALLGLDVALDGHPWPAAGDNFGCGSAQQRILQQRQATCVLQQCMDCMHTVRSNLQDRW